MPAELESLANKAVGTDEKTDKELEHQCWKKFTAARVDLKRKQEQHAKKIKLLEKAREAVAAAEEAEREAKTAEETAQAAATAAGSEYRAFKPGEHEEADEDEELANMGTEELAAMLAEQDQEAGSRHGQEDQGLGRENAGGSRGSLCSLSCRKR